MNWRMEFDNTGNEADAARKLNILIVDDESNIRKTLSYCLNAEGHEVISVGNPEDAAIEARKRVFDIAFVDLRLGEEDGMTLIPVLLSDSPWTKIVVITGNASIESAVEAIRKGASDYIVKPFSPDQVKLLSRRIGRIRELEDEIFSLKEDRRRLSPGEKLLSRNADMLRLFETARKAALSEATILLRGESGTGKSVLAKAIHNWSRRTSKSMVEVACPCVPANLLESELFGHMKGAFTGAIKDNSGRIAVCEGGTLFLDEIGDLPLSLQAKLLRFIQDKKYERLGDTVSRDADVRIIAATNVDLERQVAKGHFREDLYHRLNVISLTIPPLREHPEDIMPLALDFLAFFRQANHKTIQGFDPEVERALAEYAWPGNIRELRNTIECAVILGEGDRVKSKDMPETIAPSHSSPKVGDLISLSCIEELHIRRVLAKTSSLQEAADILCIDQATLWRKRKTYNI